MRYTSNTSCNSSKIRFSETKHIRRQTHSISCEKLSFRDGAFLGDIDLSSESGNTRRKVRRIIEKRVCQDLYRSSRAANCADNYGRYNEKRRVANSLKNIYGEITGINNVA